MRVDADRADPVLAQRADRAAHRFRVHAAERVGEVQDVEPLESRRGAPDLRDRLERPAAHLHHVDADAVALRPERRDGRPQLRQLVDHRGEADDVDARVTLGRVKRIDCRAGIAVAQEHLRIAHHGQLETVRHVERVEIAVAAVGERAEELTRGGLAETDLHGVDPGAGGRRHVLVDETAIELPRVVVAAVTERAVEYGQGPVRIHRLRRMIAVRFRTPSCPARRA